MAQLDVAEHQSHPSIEVHSPHLEHLVRTEKRVLTYSSGDRRRLYNSTGQWVEEKETSAILEDALPGLMTVEPLEPRSSLPAHSRRLPI